MLRNFVTLVLLVCVCHLSQGNEKRYLVFNVIFNTGFVFSAQDEKLYKCYAAGDPHVVKFVHFNGSFCFIYSMY